MFFGYFKANFLLNGEERVIELLLQRVSLPYQVHVVLVLHLVLVGSLFQFLLKDIDIFLAFFNLVVQGLDHLFLFFVLLDALFEVVKGVLNGADPFPGYV